MDRKQPVAKISGACFAVMYVTNLSTRAGSSSTVTS
jgi:hypothetical protein